MARRITNPDILKQQVLDKLGKQTQPQKYYDIIVIGVGSMGASACYHLAKRGHRVLGIEQFHIPHHDGEHSGQSRIIRKAYYEHPDYVPLLQAAYRDWKSLEEEMGEQVYFPTGLVYFGKPDDSLIQGVQTSSQKYAVPVESLSKEVYESICPGIQVDQDTIALFEPDAGFLTPERCIMLQVQYALDSGASILCNESVKRWSKQGDHFIVTTDKGTYEASSLVITVGPWAGKIIQELSGHLQVTRQVMAWVQPNFPESYALGKFPCWMVSDDQWPGVFYGFPILDSSIFGGSSGLKIAHHYPGQLTDPDRVNREVSPEDLQNIQHFLAKYFPGMNAHIIDVKTCLYTNTPDEHFIIDYLPGYDGKIVSAAGFSGHGFKFSSTVGAIIADLIEGRKTECSIEFLNLQRLGLV